MTPLPGTAPAANISQQQPVRGPDAPLHTPHADIRYFPSGRPLPRAHALPCTSQSDPFLVPGANDTTPSATSAQAPTVQEPAASANPRSCNKTTAKWAQKTTHATEGDLLPPRAGDTYIVPTLAGQKSVNKTVAKWIRKVDNRCRAKLLRRERRYPWDTLSPSRSVDKDALPASTPLITPPTVSTSRPVDRDALPVPTALAIPRSVPPTQVASPFPEPAAPINLTDHITQDTALFKRLGWRQFVEQRRSRSDFASLNKVDHPAQRLLKFYKERGAPVKMATKPWSQDQISAALARGGHRSCVEE